MSIKRYYPTKDNTITNAYNETLVVSGVLGNMGASDVVEVFALPKQVSTSSIEKARILMEFPISSIVTDRASGIVPASGSVSFFLKLYNAKHGELLPKNFKLVVAPISSSWEEGPGLDMESYTDLYASNWLSSSEGVSWTTPGGDYLSSPRYEQTFAKGTEDLELNITPLVEQWIANTTPNYGVGIFLTSSQENSTDIIYYTKKFFARTTEYFYKKPMIEARFNDARKDNRGDFYYSSSLLTAQENLQTLFLHNIVRGQYRNIPAIGTGAIYVNLYSGSDGPTGSVLQTAVTGGWYATGIYTASFALNKPNPVLETVYDVWFSGSEQYYTSSFNPKVFTPNDTIEDAKYLTAITNLKPYYTTDETATFRLYARPRNWYPNIYTVAQNKPESLTLQSASYSIYRISDDLRVIPHGTGSTLETLMSCDVSGNYFKFDMGILEPDYAYGLEIAIYNAYSNKWDVQPETFKFRVEKRQTE